LKISKISLKFGPSEKRWILEQEAMIERRRDMEEGERETDRKLKEVWKQEMLKERDRQTTERQRDRDERETDSHREGGR
jgi:hypothetical protein